MRQGIFVILLGALVPQKIKIMGFEGSGHVPKCRNHRNGFVGLSHKQIGKLLNQIEAK